MQLKIIQTLLLYLMICQFSYAEGTSFAQLTWTIPEGKESITIKTSHHFWPSTSSKKDVMVSDAVLANMPVRPIITLCNPSKFDLEITL